jgi:hypothetical protein
MAKKILKIIKILRIMVSQASLKRLNFKILRAWYPRLP